MPTDLAALTPRRIWQLSFGLPARRALATLALAALLAACGVLPKAGERAVYALPDPDQVKGNVAPWLPGALLVEMPHALPPLDGEDVVVVRSDGEVQVLPGVRWAAPIPRLLQDQIARQLEAMGAASSIAQSVQPYDQPLRLTSALRAFEVRESGSIFSAHAAITLTLICTRDARALATSQPIEVNASPVPKQAAAATQALRESAALLARQVGFWLHKVDTSGCVVD